MLRSCDDNEAVFIFQVKKAYNGLWWFFVMTKVERDMYEFSCIQTNDYGKFVELRWRGISVL